MRWMLAVWMALLLTPTVASAQTATIQFLSRTGGSRNVTSADRSVGRSDCSSNELWRFRVTLLTAAVAAPEIWVGNTSACESTNREPSVTATCWQVCGSMRQTCDVTLGAGLTTYEFSIPAARIIDPTGGNCSRTDIPQRTGGVGSSYIVMTINNTIVATYTNAATSDAIAYDVLPPEPPTNVTAQAGEAQVTVRWDYTSSTSTTTTDDSGTTTTTGAELNLQGFYVMCDPPPGTAATDAGVDAGIDAGSDAGVNCGTTAFATLDPNNVTLFNRYKCSDIVTAVTRSTQVAGLANGNYYRFAVVAEDLAGNRSAVSSTTLSTCVAPGPVSDFWEYYREHGGQANPAYCASRPWYSGGRGASLGLVLAAVAGVSLWRRRRSR